MRLDVKAGRCRLLVVDAQIEGCDGARAVERELHRHAAALVQHRGDDAAMQDAGLGVADEDGAIGQAGPGLAGREAVELEPADMAVVGAAALDGLGEFLERERGGWRGHGDVLDQCNAARKTCECTLAGGFCPGPVWPRQGGPKQRWWALRSSNARKERP